MSAEFCNRLWRLERRVQISGVLSAMLAGQIEREQRELAALRLEAGDVQGQGAVPRLAPALPAAVPVAANMARFLR